MEHTPVKHRNHVPNGKSGQMTVMLTFMMFVAVLILGVTLNIAELFIWHGHLQTSVDCAVFSGAVMQAEGLNKIARRNTDIINSSRALREKWSGNHIWPSFAAGRNEAINDANSFLNFNDRWNEDQRRINALTPAKAEQIALKVADDNVPSAEFRCDKGASGALTVLQRLVFPPLRMRFLYRYTYRDAKGNLHVDIRSGTGPSVATTILQKGTSDLVYFCGHLTKPSQAFVFRFRDKDGNDMLPTTFEKMRVYAAAMPYGGRLWYDYQSLPNAPQRLIQGRARYDAKLVAIATLQKFQPELKLSDKWASEW